MSSQRDRILACGRDLGAEIHVRTILDAMDPCSQTGTGQQEDGPDLESARQWFLGVLRKVHDSACTSSGATGAE